MIRLAARGLARLAAAAVARPRRTLGWTAALVGAAGGLAAVRLELRTSNLDLVDPALPEVRRFLDVAADFGTPNVLVVVLEGDDPRALRRAADVLAPRLRAGAGVRAVLARLPLPPPLPFGPVVPDPYFVSRDGGLLFLFVRPDDPRSSAATIGPFVAGVERVLAATPLAGVRAGTTGMPRYAVDDRDGISADLGRLSALSLAGVGLLFVAGFADLRRPLAVLLAVAAGVAATLGFAALWPGHLTLLSAFFASILLGLGVDAGIHVVDATEERRRRGESEGEAVSGAVAALAPGLLTATATTAAALASLTASGFRGFAELGVIAGVGMLACLLATVAVVPALLALFPGRRPAHRRRLGAALGLARRPAAIGVAVVAVAALAVPGPGFDPDYTALQPRGSEAVRLERAMVERSQFSPQAAIVTAASRGELAGRVAALRARPEVGAIQSALDLEALEAASGRPAPPEWRGAFVGASGRFAAYVHPLADVWRPEVHDGFVAAVRAVDPEATGMPILGRFMVDLSRDALVRASLLGAVFVALAVFLDFRRPAPTLVALTPTALTAALLPAAMRLAGLAYNPLDVMALPVVLGVAVDDGVHLVHRFRAEHGDLRATLDGAGRSVVLTSLTTLAGFGALALARHRGLASFGLATALGVGIALVASLAVVPALLAALGPRLLAQATGSGRAPRRSSTTV